MNIREQRIRKIKCTHIIVRATFFYFYRYVKTSGNKRNCKSLNKIHDHKYLDKWLNSSKPRFVEVTRYYLHLFLVNFVMLFGFLVSLVAASKIFFSLATYFFQ